MAVDMFINIEGVPGESRDSVHKEEIDVLAWSWGLSQSGTTHAGSGAGAGKVSVQDLSFTKYVDKASPLLMLFCSNGKHVTTATLVVRKAGTTPLEYMTIVMTDCLISSVSTGGSGGEDRLTENVTLNFAEVAYTYIVQNQDGSGGDKPAYKWKIAENTAG